MNLMVNFDSFNSASIGYEQISDWTKPSLLEFEIEAKYSKEFEYLEEVKGYKEGWDSYDGKIANKNSILSSIEILSSFTNELKTSNTLSNFPEFCLAPDGILGFEWDYAKDANLFARIFSPNKIEYVLTENNNKQSLKEIKSAAFIEMCKEKLQYNQAA